MSDERIQNALAQAFEARALAAQWRAIGRPALADDLDRLAEALEADRRPWWKRFLHV